MLDKKTMQKTIENLKKKLQLVQSYLFLNDSNRENEKSSSQKTNKTKKKSRSYQIVSTKKIYVDFTSRTSKTKK